jgi:hypothetical protein
LRRAVLSPVRVEGGRFLVGRPMKSLTQASSTTFPVQWQRYPLLLRKQGILNRLIGLHLETKTNDAFDTL